MTETKDWEDTLYERFKQSNTSWWGCDYCGLPDYKWFVDFIERLLSEKEKEHKEQLKQEYKKGYDKGYKKGYKGGYDFAWDGVPKKNTRTL